MKTASVDWAAAVKLLCKSQYSLEAKNLSQMMMEAVLPDQTTDAIRVAYKRIPAPK